MFNNQLRSLSDLTVFAQVLLKYCSSIAQVLLKYCSSIAQVSACNKIFNRNMLKTMQLRNVA